MRSTLVALYHKDLFMSYDLMFIKNVNFTGYYIRSGQ